MTLYDCRAKTHACTHTCTARSFGIACFISPLQCWTQPKLHSQFLLFAFCKFSFFFGSIRHDLDLVRKIEAFVVWVAFCQSVISIYLLNRTASKWMNLLCNHISLQISFVTNHTSVGVFWSLWPRCFIKKSEYVEYRRKEILIKLYIQIVQLLFRFLKLLGYVLCEYRLSDGLFVFVCKCGTWLWSLNIMLLSEWGDKMPMLAFLAASGYTSVCGKWKFSCESWSPCFEPLAPSLWAPVFSSTTFSIVNEEDRRERGLLVLIYPGGSLGITINSQLLAHSTSLHRHCQFVPIREASFWVSAARGCSGPTGEQPVRPLAQKLTIVGWASLGWWNTHKLWSPTGYHETCAAEYWV